MKEACREGETERSETKGNKRRKGTTGKLENNMRLMMRKEKILKSEKE